MRVDESTRFWDDLGESWQGAAATRETGVEATTAHRLAARVRRQSLTLRLAALGEALLSVAALAWGGRLVTSPGAGAFQWITGAGIALVVVIAGSFAAANRRGLWRSAGETPAAYLDLLKRRCASRLRSSRFALGLLLAETLAFSVWIPYAVDAAADPGRRLLLAYAFLAVWSGGALVVVLALRRRARREWETLVGIDGADGES